jgi:hypothetical protein
METLMPRGIPVRDRVAVLVLPDIAGRAASEAPAAIVDLKQRTLALRAVADAFCHTGTIARGRRLRSAPLFAPPRAILLCASINLLCRLARSAWTLWAKK